MAHWTEQCVCIKFCFKLGQNAAQTFEMLKVSFGEETGRNKFLSGFPSARGFDLC
jgi:hypothetical protein